MNNIKKELSEKINLYSNEEYLDGYIKKEYLTDDGDADITIRLMNKYDLFDYRTIGEQLELKQDIYTFINEKTAMLDNNIQINLHIIGLDIPEKDRGRARHIIKEHYAIELYKVQKEYRRVKKATTILILFGIIMLLLYILIYLLPGTSFLLEIFAFLFSFALWKAFENIIYTMSELKNKSESIAQKLLMEIDF